jgi:CHAT domain-containing protein
LRALLLRLDEKKSQLHRTDGKSASPALLAEIRLGLLGPDRLLLHYHLAEPKSFAWIITEHTIRQFELASRATIEEAAKRAYQFLEEGSPLKERAALQALEELAELVLDPLMASLDREIVLVSSQGSLQYIPLAALPVKRRAEKTRIAEGRFPLLLTHAVGRVPSASVALALASRRPKTDLTEALVIADPHFGAEGPPALENSRREGQRVIAHLDSGRSRLSVGGDAQAVGLQDSETTHRRWLHLATHGQHNAAFPALSRLAFAPAPGNPRPVEFLYGFEIEHLNLGAELVVLSACGSALGGPSRSEGLIGLPTAFFAAGARQVIASLWDVDDYLTVALMDSFYSSLGRGIDPLRALRGAQEDRWRVSPWPMKWATFVYLGPGPVPVAGSLASPTAGPLGFP